MKLGSIIAAILFACTVLPACGGGGSGGSSPTPAQHSVPTSIIGAPAPTVTGTAHRLADGLSYIDIKEGSGQPVVKGSTAQIRYDMYTTSGRVGGTSKTDPALKVVVGNRELIAGMDEGILSMKPGGERRLLIPAALAFGSAGIQDNHHVLVLVPPDTPVIVDLTVVSVSG